MNANTRKVLEESGLVIRAQQLLGKSLEGATADQYLAALQQARREEADRLYADDVAARAGDHPPDAEIREEVVHRAAESYLQAMGKDDYSQEDYLRAVSLVRAAAEDKP